MTASHPKLVLLRRRARDGNRPVAEILQYYAMERFLFRLGVSPYADAFVLKGAMMLRVWDARTARPTRDIDFLAFGSSDLDHVVSRLREICAVSVPDDGIRFDAESFRSERIKEGDDYQGARIRLYSRETVIAEKLHAMMWRSYLEKIGEPEGSNLSEVTTELRNFLAPALAAAHEHRSGKADWNPADRRWVS